MTALREISAPSVPRLETCLTPLHVPSRQQMYQSYNGNNEVDKNKDMDEDEDNGDIDTDDDAVVHNDEAEVAKEGAVLPTPRVSPEYISTY